MEFICYVGSFDNRSISANVTEPDLAEKRSDFTARNLNFQGLCCKICKE